MIILLSFLFFVISFFAIVLQSEKKYSKVLFCLLGLFLICIAGFRGEGIDRDFKGYIGFFNNIDNVKGPLLIEPSFIIIAWVIKNFFCANILILFLVYAALGVGIKLYGIKDLSSFWLLSLLIYFSYSFTLHEMTQIRAGVASGFLLLSIRPLYERNFHHFFFFALLAFFFHYSAILIFPLWFLKSNKIQKYLYLAVIPCAYFVHFFLSMDVFSLVDIIPFDPIHKKLLAYRFDNMGYLNVFNSWQLIRVAISFFFIWKADTIFLENKYGYLLIKIYVISTCSYVLLAFNPSFAGRIGDLFAIVDIIALPFIIYTIRQKMLAKGIVAFISFSYLYLNLFYNKIFI